MVTYWFQQMASHHLYWLRFAHLLEFILRSSYDWFVWFHYTCSYETALCCVIRNADSHMSLQSLRFSAGALLGFQRMRLKFKYVCGFAIRVPWLRNNLYEWNMQPKTRCSRPARRSAFLQNTSLYFAAFISLCALTSLTVPADEKCEQRDAVKIIFHLSHLRVKQKGVYQTQRFRFYQKNLFLSHQSFEWFPFSLLLQSANTGSKSLAGLMPYACLGHH